MSQSLITLIWILGISIISPAAVAGKDTEEIALTVFASSIQGEEPATNSSASLNVPAAFSPASSSVDDAEREDAPPTPLLSASSTVTGSISPTKPTSGVISVDACDKNGRTALHKAALSGDAKAVEKLLKAGANMRRRDKLNHRTPLHLAAKKGHAAVAELLLLKASKEGPYHTFCIIAAGDANNNTPLHLAVNEGHWDAAQVLLNVSASLDYLGVRYNASILNARNDQSRMPLHCAAISGHINILVALIQGGAWLNSRDADGNTALHLAVMHGHINIVEYLLQCGLHPDWENYAKQTALALAEKRMKLVKEGLRELPSNEIYEAIIALLTQHPPMQSMLLAYLRPIIDIPLDDPLE